MICPYCGGKARLVDSMTVYNNDYGSMWVCENYPECNAVVGCHPDTVMPLGTLANLELREMRQKVHKLLDPRWMSRRFGRSSTYAYLARKMGIERKDCHIGMFNIEMCKRALEVLNSEVKYAKP